MPVIKELRIDTVKDIYHTHMKKDFPPSELRPYSGIERLIREQAYFSFGYMEQDDILAYACFVMQKGRRGALLDYYAVSEKYRGAGIGGEFLGGLTNVLRYYGIGHVLLEVESVETAKDKDDALLRRRRISFYERGNCRMSRVKAVLFGVDYNIMYLPFSGRDLSDTAIADELETVYRLIIPNEEEFRRRARVFIP